MFPRCFLSRMASPLDQNELDHLAPKSLFFSVQYLHWLFLIGQVILDMQVGVINAMGWISYIPAQLRHMKHRMNSVQGWWQCKLICHRSNSLRNLKRPNVSGT